MVCATSLLLLFAQVVGTYAFWIHHAPVSNGSYDWTGSNDLRAFVQTAAQVGLHVFIRAGPWAHGESRNGGFPDWLQHYPGIQLRSTQPLFMSFATEWYQQIAAQLSGLYWSDGGPVIGWQLDNEYGGAADYLLALKQVALAAGVNVPFFSKTGWPSESQPQNSFLPFVGGYVDAFWIRNLDNDTDASSNFNFATLNSDPNLAPYPVLSVEIGGGMETSYHRRCAVNSPDMAAASLVQLGSGSNCLGYYIYRGATQVQLAGTNMTSQECQVGGREGAEGGSAWRSLVRLACPRAGDRRGQRPARAHIRLLCARRGARAGARPLPRHAHQPPSAAGLGVRAGWLAGHPATGAADRVERLRHAAVGGAQRRRLRPAVRQQPPALLSDARRGGRAVQHDAGRRQPAADGARGG
jgi:hypothetical protein